MWKNDGRSGLQWIERATTYEALFIHYLLVVAAPVRSLSLIIVVFIVVVK